MVTEAFEKTVMDYLAGELKDADPAEREDLLSKAQSLLQFEQSQIEVDREQATALEEIQAQ